MVVYFNAIGFADDATAGSLVLRKLQSDILEWFFSCHPFPLSFSLRCARKSFKLIKVSNSYSEKSPINRIYKILTLENAHKEVNQVVNSVQLTRQQGLKNWF